MYPELRYHGEAGEVSAAYRPSDLAAELAIASSTVVHYLATAASTGDFLHVPQGGVHAFCNEAGSPDSMLLLFTPGAPREAYFQALADIAASGRALSEDEWTDLYARHDQYMV